MLKDHSKISRKIITVLISIGFLIAGTPHGTPLARAKNVHSGNKIRTTFYNYGLMGRWMDQPEDIGGEWPINSAHEYIGDVGILVGSEIRQLNGVLVPSVVTTYSPRGSEMNRDTHWGWEPLMGYLNEDSSLVAMSHQGPPEDPDNAVVPNTWPSVWPDKMSDPRDPGWAGSWNGYFGKNQKNAEQESYFIMDDANDAEFLFYPDSTDFERRGMGLNAIVRGLQWNHVMAEDVIFWLYDIKNIGDKAHNKMVFGAVVGTITGGDGDSSDDYADFDKEEDIAYSYDHGTNLETGLGGIGSGGWSPVGLAGYAFLESPGNSIDGIDNDGDGASGSGNVISESMFEPVAYAAGDEIVLINYDTFERTVSAMPSDSLVIEVNGFSFTVYPGVPISEIERNLIDDNLNGLIDENNGSSIELASGYMIDEYLNIGLKYIDYFTGTGSDNLLIDESRTDGIDNDGDWNSATDDVGLDGAPGSGDNFYGENDGLPTSGAGTDFPGEPNIDLTDIDESDQIGLSSFFYFSFGTFSDMGWDKGLWDKLNPGYFNKSVQNVDADFLYGSGYFPLLPGESERFSLAMLFGDNLPDLVRNKKTVQTIYNQNYSFAKAPELPTLRAYAGDGYVTLYWDTKAEGSFDRLSGYDFEGYKIYKATDTRFSDAGEITDAYGSHKFDKPIKQYDLDNEHSGFFPQDLDGILFNLGNNTGLVHAWTDTNVINGHRYFYAVTAYDHGNLERSILPAETSKFVTVDKSGTVQTASNVVAVTPDAPTAGFVGPDRDELVYSVGKNRGTGKVVLSNLDPARIPSGKIYQVYFKDTRTNMLDDDGDWAPLSDTYADGVYDSLDTFFDYGLDGLPNTDDEGEGDGVITWIDEGPVGNGRYDEDEYFFDHGLDRINNNSDQGEGNGKIDWRDTGIDGLADASEPGYGFGNWDPNHDNYNKSTNCSDGFDNDGDGEIDEVDEGGECLDLGTENDGVYQVLESGELFYDGDGIYQANETGEPFIDGNVTLDGDVGHDGCRNEFEDGSGGCLETENSSLAAGEDPNGDDYNPATNCSDGIDNDGDGLVDEKGEEGECLDLGTEGNSLPDSGEPGIDLADFDEVVPKTTHFAIYDVTDSEDKFPVVPWSKAINSDEAIFNGMQIKLVNDGQINVREKIFKPSNKVEYSLNILPFKFSGYETIGVKYPRDIKIAFTGDEKTASKELSLLKTNGSYTIIPSVEVGLNAIDPYDNSEIEFGYLDQTWKYTILKEDFDPDNYSYYNITSRTVNTSGDSTYKVEFVKPGDFSFGDRMFITESLGDSLFITWAISVSSNDNTLGLHMPEDGDSLWIGFTKPFTSEDVFEFVSNAPYINTSKVAESTSKIKVVPNPYIAAASWEGQNPYATGRGPRALHFNHLPANSKISIYTLTGELVDVIYHNDPIYDGTAEWDMLTKDNLDIAYGVYLYIVEPMAGYGNSFEPVKGKFAVIK